MRRGHRGSHPPPRAGDHVNPRPAGISDEEDSDDPDFDFHAFGSKLGLGLDGGGGNNSAFVPIPKIEGTENPPQAATSTAAVTEEDWELDTGTSKQPSEQEIWGTTTSTIVRNACIRGNLTKLKEQLEKTPNFNLNEFFRFRDFQETEETPLITACMHGQLDIVQFLLTKGADPNLRHPFEKQTPLMALVGCRNTSNEEELVQCAEKLVEAGANVNQQNRSWLSALMIAVKQKKLELVKYLLESGADPNLTDQEGRTALFIAVLQGNGRLCRRLIEHGADVTLEDNHGMSVSEIAQDQGFLKLANFLFLVRDTKWRPGLHPELMEQLDESQEYKRRLKNDPGQVSAQSAVQLMLEGADGGKYLDKFLKHKIGYAHLLTLDDERLKEIGVDEVGVRERLLQSIKESHNTAFQPGSIRSIANNKNVTAAEAVCMIVNIKEHLEHISSTLMWMNNRIKQNPLALQYDLERNRMEDLLRFCEQAELRTRQLRGNLLEVHKSVGELVGYTELQIVGRLPKRNFNERGRKEGGSGLEELVIGMGIVLVGLFMGMKYFKRL